MFYTTSHHFKIAAFTIFINIYFISRVGFKANNKLWSGPGCLYQLTWWKDDTLLALGKFHENKESVICEILLTESDGKYTAKYK